MGVAGPKSLRQLLEAVIGLGADLDLSATLRRIIEAATVVADARYGALGVLDDSRTALSEFITVGVDDATRARIGELPKGHGILGLLIAHPEPLRLPDLREHPDSFGFPPGHPPMRSFLGVPISIRGEVFGNLYFCDKRGGEVFTDVDEELAVGLATAAGVAIENARLHALVGQLATFEDRERIARDLHDTVIQRLFAIGMSLQATVPLIADRRAVDRVLTVIDDLDATVRDVRATIFELHTVRIPGRSIRQELIQLCAESARGLGFDPVVRFDGPLDTAVDDDVAGDLIAVSREALANVAKHAHATSVRLSVEVSHGVLSMSVVDDGIGPQRSETGRGIENLTARATARGGTFHIEPGPERGTQLVWSVPLDDVRD